MSANQKTVHAEMLDRTPVNEGAAVDHKGRPLEEGLPRI